MACAMAVRSERLFRETLRHLLRSLSIDGLQVQVSKRRERSRVLYGHGVVLDRIALDLFARRLAAAHEFKVGMLGQRILGRQLVEFRVKLRLVHARASFCGLRIYPRRNKVRMQTG